MNKSNQEKKKLIKMDITPIESADIFEGNNNARACELVTGLKPNDPRILDKFQEDQLLIRKKYGLPPVEMLRSDPGEYEYQLNLLMKKNKIRHLSLIEVSYGNKLYKRVKRYDDDIALARPGRREVAVDIHNQTEKDYKESLGRLEHELLHVLQFDKYPSLLPELVEYEAYVLSRNIGKLRDIAKEKGVENATYTVFGGGYMVSVAKLYEQKGGVPPWEDLNLIFTSK